MDDLARQMEEAREYVEPGWDAARVESSLVRLQGRMRRRRSARFAAAALAPVLLAAAAALAWSWSGRAASTRPVASVRPETPPTLDRQASGTGAAIHFADGSTATALTADSHLVADEVSPTRVRVRLDGGAARFEVSPSPDRVFEVDAGPVTVRVLGTIFSVTRTGQDVTVSVERGRVRVDGRDGEQIVAAGERQVFHPHPHPRSTPPTPEPPVEVVAVNGPQVPNHGGDAREARDSGRRRRETPEPSSWQALAQAGRYDEAWDALGRAGGLDAVSSPMSDALLASDVARLSGHPNDAVRVLEQAIARAPGDPLASVAHYTLGRVLLTQVSRPRDAAEAFARARRLAPGGALAEDALAREVEAWSRAGDAAQARRRAGEYVALYPNGRRLGAVRRQGGLDAAPTAEPAQTQP
jgi:transmembrane sensor